LPGCTELALVAYRGEGRAQALGFLVEQRRHLIQTHRLCSRVAGSRRIVDHAVDVAVVVGAL
jgi:hypothetical protein